MGSCAPRSAVSTRGPPRVFQSCASSPPPSWSPERRTRRARSPPPSSSRSQARDRRERRAGADRQRHRRQPDRRGGRPSGSAGGATASAVTDSAGNTYTELTHFTASDKTELSVWSAPITAGGGTKPTVTVKASASADVGADRARVLRPLHGGRHRRRRPDRARHGHDRRGRRRELRPTRPRPRPASSRSASTPTPASTARSRAIPPTARGRTCRPPTTSRCWSRTRCWRAPGRRRTR